MNQPIAASLVRTAKGLANNISKAAKERIRTAVCQSLADQWKLANQAALNSYNSYVAGAPPPVHKRSHAEDAWKASQNK
ncbi:type II toxin-antitoxin system CcdA family antitoxin [Roseibium salinum]|uniref:Type II toxin-antitoxin system CcdA family antitoxin n=1 Tax=Roseibium salinum TaxID=1604349 RepID=A0ABT3QWC7_9HYPH|nr:type II toxin-antitoxin system CcdA family antitoxin [Roseibium sp. DSM 29163]MCX2721224.1 type II toxin-antitoxin system CcdA family antitoxin [Roseibium sp. DSM 29163]MDN3722691.1 type II toxin-antitoxin system CcdA family antitoxin [Roseibium salinum]